MKLYNLAIIGATGLVGRKTLEVLGERSLPLGECYLFASKRSYGKTMALSNREYFVEELTEKSFEDRDIDIALFIAGADVALKFAPLAASKGILVIDNSTAFRADPDVPLIVPEVNPSEISKAIKGIIASPSPSVVEAAVVLKPLHERYGIKRIVFSTYQAVTGAGWGGYNDLAYSQSGQNLLKLPHPISYNVFPHIEGFMPDGYTQQEHKMMEETRRVLMDGALSITATSVRVPVYRGHSESINIEFKSAFELGELKDLLSRSPGVTVLDDPNNNIYPMPSTAAEKDEVFVGRIRRDSSVESGVDLWVVADNLRKGAATNIVQIAEEFIKGRQNIMEV